MLLFCLVPDSSKYIILTSFLVAAAVLIVVLAFFANVCVDPFPLLLLLRSYILLLASCLLLLACILVTRWPCCLLGSTCLQFLRQLVTFACVKAFAALWLWYFWHNRRCCRSLMLLMYMLPLAALAGQHNPCCCWCPCFFMAFSLFIVSLVLLASLFYRRSYYTYSFKEMNLRILC